MNRDTLEHLLALQDVFYGKALDARRRLHTAESRDARLINRIKAETWEQAYKTISDSLPVSLDIVLP